jgi:signal transduction histidine kinase
MSSPPGSAGADEAAGLRRTLRDLVGLSVLPIVWSAYDTAGVIDSLAEVMLKTLSLDLLYISFPRRGGAGLTEAVRLAPGGDETAGAEVIGGRLAPWLGDPFSPTAAIPHPAPGAERGQAVLHIAVTRFGYASAAGIMVAGCARPDFPAEQERLLLGFGANQAAVAIQRRWVEEERLLLLDQAQLEIAERRRVEDGERAARAQAEQAIHLRDEFLATLSHELRTPLNSVLGWAQVLRREPLDEPTRTKAVDAIERGAHAQTRLIEDLLDMSRIVSGKLRLDVQTVDLMPLLQAAIETVQPAAEAKEVRIARVIDPAAGPVKGDPARLQQVFWNLLSNAVKFTPRGGRVQVCLQRINSHVEVTVSDSGRGIAPDFLPFVFDRFSQADASTTRRHGGLGLGLALVRQLVELHGGKVWAESSGEGRGAAFTVHLPIAIVQQDQQGREHPAAPRYYGAAAGDEVRLPEVRLLVVDDDVNACEILSRVLRDRGAVVDVVASGREALEQVGRIEYSVIVSDIGMPDMDGYELIRALRARGVKTPAVAVTAFARSEDRIRALTAGFNMHVAKPLEPRELVAVVAALMRPGYLP